MEEEYVDNEYVEAHDNAENTYQQNPHETEGLENLNAQSNSDSREESKIVSAVSDDTMKQIQQTLHNQTNEIANLKKDLCFWKNKWAQLNIDFRSAQYDWNKAKNIKSSILQENKDLKEKVLQYEDKIKEQEDVNASYKQMLEDKEAAEKQRAEEQQNAKVVEPEPKEPVNLEQDIMTKVWAITDMNSLMRIYMNITSLYQQRYYAQSMSASKPQDSNGGISGGNDAVFNSGMYYFPGPMMNPMHMMQMNPSDANYQQTNVSKANSSTK